VREQIRVAAGEALGFTQADVRIAGHAIECRVNAEHPETFVPSPGLVRGFHPPGGPGVRIDSALYAGYRIPSNYDSLIAKLIVYGDDRAHCLRRLGRALEEFVVDGVDTTLPLHRRILAEPDFIAGDYDIHWLEAMLARER
jgi:acetyl-CoA carboxylase biotin carboxylase subunit